MIKIKDGLELMVQINCNLTLKAGKIRLQHHCNGSLNSRGWCIKFATHKWPLQLTKVHFMTISSRFFANYFDIFHKTEVQTVILRWWTGLNLNWLKSYDTNSKYLHFNPSRIFDAPPYIWKLLWKVFQPISAQLCSEGGVVGGCAEKNVQLFSVAGESQNTNGDFRHCNAQ